MDQYTGMKTIYITSPLYYVNAAPHIGHAYTQIICDAVARFQKQRGHKVFFMTGTDEHGEKIEKAALEAGFAAGEEKKFVDTVVPRFTALWKKLNIGYDHFIRTTDKTHKETVKEILTLLYDKEKIYKKVYEGWFCTPCEAFWSDSQAPSGICPDCGRKAEKLNEENYFFKISKYQNALIDHIKRKRAEKTPFIIPQIRENEVLSFLEKNKLQDLCISRPKTRLSWGVGVPFDKNFVTYVWFDALINYISGVGYTYDRPRFDSIWPAYGHFIGKDILRHHAIYWPIILMALGEKLPGHIFTHGWWVIKGEKMSKSRGNIVDPEVLIEKYDADAFRYFLLSAVQFGYDGTFSEELFIRKYNDDLANDLGNLVNRTLTMLEKYFDGIVPSAGAQARDKGPGEAAGAMPARMGIAFADGDSWLTLKIIWDRIGWANKYIENEAPWKLAKENTDRLKIVLYNLTQTLGAISVCLYPFMPDAASSMWKQLGMKSDVASIKLYTANAGEKGKFWGIIPPGTKTCKGKPLFPRIK